MNLLRKRKNSEATEKKLIKIDKGKNWLLIIDFFDFQP